jgi:hypothetical protein
MKMRHMKKVRWKSRRGNQAWNPAAFFPDETNILRAASNKKTDGDAKISEWLFAEHCNK